MAKLICGGVMTGLDALTCALAFGDSATTSSTFYGMLCLSLLGATPVVMTCADAWFDSLTGPTRAE